MNPDPPEFKSYEGLYWLGTVNIFCTLVADPSHAPVIVIKLPILVKYPTSRVIWLPPVQPDITIWEQAIASFNALPCLASNA